MLEKLNPFRSNKSKADMEPTKAYRIADPTTFSELPFTEAPRKVGRVEHKDYDVVEMGGEQYVRLESEPEIQQAMVRLLKGVIPAADIVSYEKKDGEKEYFSKMFQLDKIQTGMSRTQGEAIVALLAYVFNDFDHIFPGHNVIHKKNRGAFFDFETIGLARRELHIPEGMEAHYAHQFGPNPAVKMNRLLPLFRAQYEGDAGKKFIRSCIQHLDSDHLYRLLYGHTFDINLPDTTVDEAAVVIQESLLQRINALSGLFEKLESHPGIWKRAA